MFPNLGTTSVQSLLYTPIYLLFTPNSVSSICHCVLSRMQCANVDLTNNRNKFIETDLYMIIYQATKGIENNSVNRNT